jgi:hypothetical protein
MRSSPRLLRLLITALILALTFLALGCTPKIPNQITSQEMSLYRDWLKQRFANQPPEHLYLDDQTFVFDPLRQEGCAKALHKDDRVSNSLMRELHNLGNADYGIDVSPASMKLPWSYQVLNVRHLPSAAEGLHMISFSRVAFDRGEREALFAVNDLCGSQCGSGRAISARKEHGVWVFKDSSACSWKY